MNISMIVATDAAGGIGKGGVIPWDLPDDMVHFRSTTMGKPVIMGSATYKSIGRPLRGRRNIVLSSMANGNDGVEYAGTVDEAIRLAGDSAEVMVIGGESVYSQFSGLANKIYHTKIHANFDCDRFFSVKSWLFGCERFLTSYKGTKKDKASGIEFSNFVLERLHAEE